MSLLIFTLLLLTYFVIYSKSFAYVMHLAPAKKVNTLYSISVLVSLVVISSMPLTSVFLEERDNNLPGPAMLRPVVLQDELFLPIGFIIFSFIYLQQKFFQRLKPVTMTQMAALLISLMGQLFIVQSDSFEEISLQQQQNGWFFFTLTSAGWFLVSFYNLCAIITSFRRHAEAMNCMTGLVLLFFTTVVASIFMVVLFLGGGNLPFFTHQFQFEKPVIIFLSVMVLSLKVTAVFVALLKIDVRLDNQRIQSVAHLYQVPLVAFILALQVLLL